MYGQTDRQGAKNRSIYVQIRTKWFNDHRPIVHIIDYISPAKMLSFCENLQQGCIA